MIFGIDSYYTIEEYNKVIDALKYNGIDYQEFISTKNYQFFIKTPGTPFTLKYDIPNTQFTAFFVAKTQFLQSSEEVRFTRRAEHGGKAALKLAYNDAFDAMGQNYCYFFHLPNAESARALSQEIGKIWYFGKYAGNRYKVYLTNNEYLPKFVSIDNILASGNTPLEAEMELYYSGFNRRDRLRKFSQTPAYDKGNYIRPKILAPFFKTAAKVGATK